MRKTKLEKAKHEVKSRYTFIVASNTNGDTLKFSLSAFWVKNLVLVGSVLLCTFVLLLSSYLSLLGSYNQSKVDMFALQAINKEQKEQMFEITKLVTDVENEIILLDLMQQRLQELIDDGTSSQLPSPKSVEVEDRIAALLKAKEGSSQGDSNYLKYYKKTDNMKELDIVSDLSHLRVRLEQSKVSIDVEKTRVQELEKTYDKTDDFAQCYPDFTPTVGNLSSRMGWRTDPSPSFHKGIDLANRYGTPIYSAGKGKVIQAEWQSSYGYTILIDHGYGYKTRYGHCSKLLVKVGDIVQKGDLIALSGNTGYSFGNHLHFEVIENGVHVDPLRFIKLN